MENMQELVDKGLSYRKIAKILGVHHSTISNRMRKKGIKVSDPSLFVKEGSEIKCSECQRIYTKDRKKGHKGLLCNSCSSRKRERINKEKISLIIGDSCCKCGYDKCKESIEYHHILDKEFALSVGFKNYSLSKLENEAKKCIPFCANCHREFHYKLFTYNDIDVNKLKDYQKELLKL